ncbi:hypothetical protein COV20_02975 [Candidatus Woesearchaeota archaeon CG10_big_fil_rev_8_21_14_0_10_45_16]|nr:MAG: hypothetical protein COV20_02975 [Candidatus Woesearchaeota archaeon CG10_big_fil_rev_8_21_14_0_10_45_16]
MRIRFKLSLLIIIPLVIAGLIQIFFQTQIAGEVASIRENNIRPSLEEIDAVYDIRLLSSQIALSIDQAILFLAAGDEEAVLEETVHVAELKKQRLDRVDDLQAISSGQQSDPYFDSTTRNLNSLTIAIDTANPVSEEIIAEIKNAVNNEEQFNIKLIQEINRELTPLHETIFEKATQLVEEEKQEIEELEAAVIKKEKQIVLLSYLITIISVITIILVSILIVSQIVGRIESLTTRVREVRAARKGPKQEFKKSDDEISTLTEQFEELITRTERYEAQLEKNVVELKSIDKQKDILFSQLSHELKTPLAPIMGYLEMIYNGEYGKVSKQQREKLAICYRNASNLLKLVEDFLNLTRLELNKIKLNISSENLCNVANDVREDLDQLARGHNAQIAVVCKKEARIHCDKQRIREIFTNLIKNSILYGKKGKKNTITITITDRAEEVSIEIKDQGMGIPKKDIKKLFNQFERAQQAIRSPGIGTGLGLVITKRLIELQGGTISVESKEGSGSTFTFTLPKKRGVKK